MSHRPLLILDLDETLVHASECELDRAPDHRVGPYALYLRPGLREFLVETRKHYQQAVWTSSSPRYAAEVCAIVFPDPAVLRFIWASDRCTVRRDPLTDEWASAKSLRRVKRLGFDLNRVLVVDDSPEKHRRNYGNLVQVAEFLGHVEDDELAHLAPYLARLAGEADLRRIEKRRWRSRINERPGSPSDT